MNNLNVATVGVAAHQKSADAERGASLLSSRAGLLGLDATQLLKALPVKPAFLGVRPGSAVYQTRWARHVVLRPGLGLLISEMLVTTPQTNAQHMS